MSNGQFPNHSGKLSEEGIFSPSDWLSYVKKQGWAPSFAPPVGVIFSYQTGFLQWVLKNHANTRCDGCFSKLNYLTETQNQVAIFGGFGIGAPAATTALEELIAFGVKKFISIGSAGSLQKNILVGDLVVLKEAIRDEGTSYHYLPPQKFAHPSKDFTSLLEKKLAEKNIHYSLGSSWTIDSPYRETKAEVLAYQQEGIACVEMEAAALFAVAEYRKVEMASMISISDTLADLRWSPEFHSAKVSAGLESLFQVAVDCLQS